MKFILPFPPSVNSKYTMSRGRRGKSAKDLAWEAKATDAINAQNILPFNGRCYVIYELNHPDNRPRDAANYEKKVTDLLVSKKILPGDDRRWIKGVLIHWNDTPGKQITVKIIPVDEFGVIFPTLQ